MVLKKIKKLIKLKLKKRGKKQTEINLPRFKKKDIPKLNYGIIHSQVGFVDGVSIVMKQVESVMVNDMGIPK